MEILCISIPKPMDQKKEKKKEIYCRKVRNSLSAVFMFFVSSLLCKIPIKLWWEESGW